jgi:hypothetical protein
MKQKNLRGRIQYEHWEEIKTIIDSILSKKEVDEEAIQLRDRFYELFKKELRNQWRQEN